MEVDEDRSDAEKEEEEEDDSVSDLLRDRFRLSAISIAEAEGPFCPQTLCFFFGFWENFGKKKKLNI